MRYNRAIRCLSLGAVSLAICSLAETRALASCGDYVMVGGHDLVHASSHGSQHESQSPPCRGPNCSRRSLPDPQPPVTSITQDRDLGLPLEATPEPSVEPLGWIIAERWMDPLAASDPLFSPQRRAACAAVC